MIVHDQILPSLYHLQRLGQVGDITIVATSSARIADLTNKRFDHAFPGQSFNAHPPPDSDPNQRHPDLYQQVVADMPAGNLVVIATPDQLHDEMLRYCLQHDQHVLCVKPLVQTHAQAIVIEKLAREKGLFVGIEYHKRFDRRVLEAREQYSLGRFGEFKIGHAAMIEPYYYRNSNFQNWFTKQNSDPFTYVGCHYVDQVYFITGLRPTSVAVTGVEGTFPNGNNAWMWANGTVIFNNGSVLTVNTGLGYPDQGAGTNDQGITLYCEGPDGKASAGSAIISHNDQFRGVSHGYLDENSGAHFRYINPDYFRLVPWTAEGLKPVGYGYDSIEANVVAANQVAACGSIDARQAEIAAIDTRNLIATPANSSINEQVVEAARQSLTQNGKRINI